MGCGCPDQQHLGSGGGFSGGVRADSSDSIRVIVDTFTLQEAPLPRYVLGEESLDILKGENARGCGS